jgi:tRNA nucleotidyltransferase/poly(A) polymerase
MVRELEKGGARVLSESERLRHYELTFAGDVDGSISSARDDVYERPGTKPDYRFSGIMEDLRRRDFSVNAIAISLNTQSRGLLLDPMNGLADLERQEVRALSIHAFTNQPIRLLRILRYAARMGFKIESRTQEWFDLAVERGLHENLQGPDVGEEFRALTREDNPVATLKVWESHDLLTAIHPQLQKRKPDYDSLNKLARVRINLYSAGIRPRLSRPVLYYALGRLKPRDAAAAMRVMEFRSTEIEALGELVPEAQKVVHVLKGRKTNAPKDAYTYIASLPGEMLAFIEVEFPHSPVVSKLHNFIQKWRPLRQSLPIGELDALGVPRGPKFDKILDQLFEMQLRGRARTPEDRTKALRQLAGVKEEPKKKPEKEKKKRGDKSTPVATDTPPGAKTGSAKQPPDAGHSKSAAAAIGAKAQAKHDASHADRKHQAVPAGSKRATAKKSSR